MRTRFTAVAMLALLASVSEAQQRTCTAVERMRNQCKPPASQQSAPTQPAASVPTEPAIPAAVTPVVPAADPVSAVSSSDTIPPKSAVAQTARNSRDRHQGTTFYSPRIANDKLIYAELIRSGGKFRNVSLNTTPDEILEGVQKYYPKFGVEDLVGLYRLIRESEVGECPSGIVKLAWVDKTTRKIRYDSWEREMGKGVNAGEKCLIKDGVAWASLLCGNTIVPDTPVLARVPTPSLPPAPFRPDTVVVYNTVPVVPTVNITVKKRNPWPWIIGAAVVGGAVCESASRRFGNDPWAFSCFQNRTRVTVVQTQSSLRLQAQAFRSY